MIRLAKTVSIFMALALFMSISQYSAHGNDAPVKQLPGLQAEVEIWRDEYGVAHIRAENEKDMFFAFGYITATDRLFQMDGSRRVAQGRLSELFGRSWLWMDINNRDLGFGRTAREMWENLNDDSRAALVSYTRGVNCYIEENKDHLPMEFIMLGYEPELWKETDSLAIVRLFSWWLSSDKNSETLRNYILVTEGSEKVLALMPPIPVGSEEALPVPPGSDFPDEDIDETEPVAADGPVNGSNCWAVSAGKSKDGYAILASDPHMELFAPSSWYQVHITGGRYDVIGVSVPGLPIIPIGHNENVAWGASNMPYDIQDMTYLELNAQNNDQYRWGDEFLDFEIQEEIIFIGMGEDAEEYPFERRMSKAGVVLNESPGSWYTIALRWTGLEGNDEMKSFLQLMRIDSADDVSDAMVDFNCAPQSFITADTGGHIGQTFAGKIPTRENYTGLYSTSGKDMPEWVGFIGTKDLPAPFDPPEGYVVHANNLPPYCFGTACGNFKAPYIYQRIQQLLDANPTVDVDYMKSMQMDVLNLFAVAYIDFVVDAGKRGEGMTLDLKDGLEILGGWDMRETEDSPEAVLFHEYYILFTKKIFKNVMKESSLHYYLDSTHAVDAVMRPLVAGNPDPVLFSDITMAEVESAALDALGTAHMMLRVEYGEDHSRWNWGRIHKTAFKHPSGVKFLLSAGTHSDRGSRYTIKVADFFNSTRYESTFGVSYRQVIEMRPGDIRGWWVLPPGNHGSAFSSHYKDQVKMWLKGEYAPMYFYDDEISKNCDLQVILTPSGGS